MQSFRLVLDLPDAGPTSVGQVKAHLGITDGRDDAAISSAVDAVNAVVECWPVVADAAGAEEWPAYIERGATLLAARLHRRRNSPGGLEALGEFGPAYVQRMDPDVAMLLRLGSWSPPAVG